jgi:hypothetical protein
MAWPHGKPSRVVLPAVSGDSPVGSVLLVRDGAQFLSLVATEDRRLSQLGLVSDGLLSIVSSSGGNVRTEGALSAMAAPSMPRDGTVTVVGALGGSSSLLKGNVRCSSPDLSGKSSLAFTETSRFQLGHSDEVSSAAFHPDPALPHPILASLDDDGTLCVSALVPASPGSKATSLKPLAVCRKAHTSVGSSVCWRPTRRRSSSSSSTSSAWPVGEPSITLQLVSSGFDNRIILYEVTINGTWKKSGSARRLAAADEKKDVASDDDGDAGGFSVLVSAATSGSSGKSKKMGGKKGVKSPSSTSNKAGTAVAAVSTAVSGTTGGDVGDAQPFLDLTGAKITMIKAWNAGKQCALVPLKEEEEAETAEEEGTSSKDQTKEEGGAEAAPSEAKDPSATKDDDVGGVSLIEPSRLVNPPFAHQVVWLPGRGGRTAGGNCFAAAVGNGLIFVINADTGSKVCSFQAHNAAATCVVPVVMPPPSADDHRHEEGDEGEDDDEDDDGLRTNLALPLYLFSAGNDKRVCLYKVDKPAKPATEEGKSAAAVAASSPSLLPLQGTIIWSKKHTRGGINSVHSLVFPPSASGAAKSSGDGGASSGSGSASGGAGSSATEDKEQQPKVALLVADVTEKLTAYVF